MYRMISEIESTADSCYTLAKTLKLKKTNRVWFDEEMRKNINDLFDLTDLALKEMNNNIDSGYSKITSISMATLVEKKVNQKTVDLLGDHLIKLEEKKYTYNAGVIYADIISETERLNDHAINISEAIIEIRESITLAT